MLRALFFDFDGLIVDTETPEVETWQEIFAEHGLEFPDEYWMNAIGRGADQIEERPVDLLSRLCGKELDLEAIEKDYRVRAHNRIDAQPVRPGIIELATEARAHGLNVAIVSSSGHEWVTRHTTRRDIAGLFDRRVCREDVAQAKPHPDLYLRACELFGIEPAQAITLEDSPNGLHAANAAGVFGIAVPNDLTARLDLSHARARVDSLAGLTLADLSALRS